MSEKRGVGSSMVEQRPFKALVEGSSPSQPIFPGLQAIAPSFFPARKDRLAFCGNPSLVSII